MRLLSALLSSTLAECCVYLQCKHFDWVLLEEQYQASKCCASSPPARGAPDRVPSQVAAGVDASSLDDFLGIISSSTAVLPDMYAANLPQMVTDLDRLLLACGSQDTQLPTMPAPIYNLPSYTPTALPGSWPDATYPSPYQLSPLRPEDQTFAIGRRVLAPGTDTVRWECQWGKEETESMSEGETCGLRFDAVSTLQSHFLQDHKYFDGGTFPLVKCLSCRADWTSDQDQCIHCLSPISSWEQWEYASVTGTSSVASLPL